MQTLSAMTISGFWTRTAARLPPWLLWLLAMLLVATLYLLIAYPLAHFQRGSYLSTPVKLQWGMAIAILLCWGRSLWPGIYIANVTMTLLLTSRTGWDAWAVALPIALGPALTAWLVVTLLRRAIPAELHRLQGMDWLRFMALAAGLGPAVLATWGSLLLALGFKLPWAQAPGVWLDWFAGGSVGVLVGLPVTLCIVARPREHWRPRLLSLGLPLLLAAAVLLLAMGLARRWDRQHQFADFEQAAQATSDAVAYRLAKTLSALSAAQQLMLLAPAGGGGEAGLSAIGRLYAGEGSADAPGFAQGMGSGNAPMQQAGWPEALARSERTGKPAVVDGPGSLVAAVQALGPQRPGAAVYVSLHAEALLAARTPASLHACLLDRSSGPVRRLVGEEGCEKSLEYQPDHWRSLSFADRQWRLRLYPVGMLKMHTSPKVKAIELAGLASIGAISLLLLHFSGRAVRISALLDSRNAALAHTSQALRRHEQRFQSVFEHAPVGVCISALDGVPLDANQQFCRMRGCSLAELIGRAHPDTAEDARLAAHLGQEKYGSTRHLRRGYPQADGSRLEAHLILSLLRDGEGRPEALLCVAEDITDRLQLQAREHARRTAEMANLAKSEFLSRMSHELRTPLNGLLGFTQLLQMESQPLSRIQRSWVARIGQAGWHLLAMIDDVLDLSRVETGEPTVQLQAVDAQQLADECLNLLATAAERRGISLRRAFSPEGRYVMADPTRLREILNNLLSNAIKYNVDGGKVRLALRPGPGGWLDFAVADTGPGLSEAQLGALFQPFNRLGQERSGTEGTGLGLVITRRLAELMGGSLTVASKPGHGSVFTLRLPAAREPASAAGDEGFPSTLPAWQGTRRLLYIEDNPANALVMQEVVALRGEQLSLKICKNGSDGLAALHADPPDLLLLDVHLPDSDGVTLIEQLRRSPRHAELPVLVVSADATERQIRRALEAGASHYLVKPFAIAKLLTLIDRLLVYGEAH